MYVRFWQRMFFVLTGLCAPILVLEILGLPLLESDLHVFFTESLKYTEFCAWEQELDTLLRSNLF